LFETDEKKKRNKIDLAGFATLMSDDRYTNILEVFKMPKPSTVLIIIIFLVNSGNQLVDKGFRDFFLLLCSFFDWAEGPRIRYELIDVYWQCYLCLLM